MYMSQEELNPTLRADLIEDILALAEEYRRFPSEHEVQVFATFDSDTFRHEFGSVENALDEAIDQFYTQLSSITLDDALCSLYPLVTDCEALTEQYLGSELQYRPLVYYSYFHDLETMEYVKYCPEPTQSRDPSYEELLNHLLTVYDTIGRSPIPGDFTETVTGYTVEDYTSAFGSFETALTLAGIWQPDFHPLIKTVIEYGTRPDEPPGRKTIQENFDNFYTSYKYFENWDEVLMLTGFDPEKKPSHSANYVKIHTDELIRELTHVAETLGETPTVAQMDAHGEYCGQTYIRRFGSWNEALENAGYIPEHEKVQAVSDEQLIADLQRVGKELGHVPRIADINEYGKYARSTYSHHFGSWRQALTEAGFDPDTNAHRLTVDELLEEVRRLAGELGKIPGVADMKNHGSYSREPYYNRFDSWSDVIEAAGLSEHSVKD